MRYQWDILRLQIAIGATMKDIVKILTTFIEFDVEPKVEKTLDGHLVSVYDMEYRFGRTGNLLQVTRLKGEK